MYASSITSCFGLKYDCGNTQVCAFLTFQKKYCKMAKNLKKKEISTELNVGRLDVAERREVQNVSN